jgi:predicted nuclease of restriction endonuclease-like (RecB) superfamily
MPYMLTLSVKNCNFAANICHMEHIIPIQQYSEAIQAIKNAIVRSRHRAVTNVNKEILSLNYAIGRYISEHSRIEYWGKGAIEAISAGLQKELPGVRGFSVANIKNMRQFYEEWSPYVNRQPLASDLQINEDQLLSLIRQPLASDLDWKDFVALPFSSHMEILRKTTTVEERIFYIHESVSRSWNKYTLREYLKAHIYNERGNLPNNFSTTLPDTTQIVKATKMFREEYIMDFVNTETLGVPYEDIDERVLEHQIVENIRKFILTFGNDFIFMGNQYRIVVAGEELFIDLLFFNRELNAMVAVELKSGKFKQPYLGQLSGYLSALDKFVKKPHENPSIGIILCREMNKAFVEFAIQDFNKPMGVATYRTNEGMPEKYQKALPDINALRRILESEF